MIETFRPTTRGTFVNQSAILFSSLGMWVKKIGTDKLFSLRWMRFIDFTKEGLFGEACLL